MKNYLFFLFSFFCSIILIISSPKEIKILTKIGDQIITNIDIENEYKYLISLNNDYKKLEKEKFLISLNHQF